MLLLLKLSSTNNGLLCEKKSVGSSCPVYYMSLMHECSRTFVNVPTCKWNVVGWVYPVWMTMTQLAMLIDLVFDSNLLWKGNLCSAYAKNYNATVSCKQHQAREWHADSTSAVLIKISSTDSRHLLGSGGEFYTLLPLLFHHRHNSWPGATSSLPATHHKWAPISTCLILRNCTDHSFACIPLSSPS